MKRYLCALLLLAACADDRPIGIEAANPNGVSAATDLGPTHSSSGDGSISAVADGEAKVTCDKQAIDQFVEAHASCVTYTDCVPLCTLGPCDLRTVNQSAAADISITFAGCQFGECELPGPCEIAPFSRRCVKNRCNP